MFRFRLMNVGAIVSITLVLLFLGLVAKFSMLSFYLKKQAQEDIGFNVFLSDNVSPQEAEQLMGRLAAFPEAKHVEYSSKEEALKHFIEEGNENPVEILDYNPLPASIHIFVVDSVLEPEKLRALAARIKEMPEVVEVRYAEDFLSALNENVNKITLAMLGVVLLLLIVSVVLIHNTIRLTLLNDRFVLKTMQYAGASNFFIASPYLKRSVWYGILGGGLASLTLVGVDHYVSLFFEQWTNATFEKWNWVIFSLLALVGVFIAFLSTINSVYRYLKTAVSKLY